MSDIRSLDGMYRDIVGNDAYNNKNVTIKSISRDYSNKFSKLQLCFISDPHIGSSDFDIKGLIENLEYANSQDNAVVFFLGDAMNTAIIGSKSDPYEDIMNPQQQLSFFSEVLKLAKGNQKLLDIINNLNNSGKIIVIHSGNHEDRITKSVGVPTMKMAADIAGAGEAYAPFFATTTLKLRQPGVEGGAFPINIITHHGTGISNSDGIFRLIRNVGNVDMAVIGHTHQHTTSYDRTIKVDENGRQYYHDIMYVTLPSSGGGTYGAGMALADTNKQTAFWVEASSQPCPFAGKVSPTGVAYPAYVPAFAVITPSNTPNTEIQEKRIAQARKIIGQASQKLIKKRMMALIKEYVGYETRLYDRIAKIIAEKPLQEPEGLEDYLARICDELEKENSNSPAETSEMGG